MFRLNKNSYDLTNSIFWCIHIRNSIHNYSTVSLFDSFLFTKSNHSVHNPQWWVKFFYLKKIIELVPHLLLVFVLLKVKLIIICSLCFLHVGFYYFKCSTCSNHSQFWNHKIYIETKVIETWSSPRYPHCSNFLVCIKNHLFIVGIGPIRDKDV